MLGGTPGTLYPLTGPLGQMFIRQAHHSVQGEIVAMAKRSKQKKKRTAGTTGPLMNSPLGKISILPMANPLPGPWRRGCNKSRAF